MDSLKITVTIDEFKLFHGIDRELYVILIRDLVRNPLECLYIMGLWLWLERAGFLHFVSKVLSLPPFLINELADEAITCINCMNIHFPFSSEATEIPLTHSLVKKDISLQFFVDHHLTAFNEVEALVRDVCIPTLSDIMENGYYGSYVRASTWSPVIGPGHAGASTSYANPVQEQQSHVENVLMHSISSLGIDVEPDQFKPHPHPHPQPQPQHQPQHQHQSQPQHQLQPSPTRGKARASESSRNDRTMFVTFSKGYPVSEEEVKNFFERLLGNCIESFHMQEVDTVEQSLYAKIVFLRASFIRAILNGVSKAKFTINGKHVWMRKFVPKQNRPPPCGCSSIKTCTCCFF